MGRALAVCVLAGCNIGAPSRGDRPALRVSFAVENPCAIVADELIGAEHGCTVELQLALAADQVPDPDGWTIDVSRSGQSQPIASVILARGAPGTFSFVAEGSNSEWRATSTWYFTVTDRDGVQLESRPWDIVVVQPTFASTPDAWLWGAYWRSGWLRLRDSHQSEVDCEGDVRIVSIVGGDLTKAATIVTDVYDVDIGGRGMSLDSETWTFDGIRRHELVPEGLCLPDTDGSTVDAVDPQFLLELRNAAGDVLDSHRGPELDID